MSLLGTRVKARREERGLGQEELAAQLGVRQQTISRWEKGLALPRPARLLQLADALGLDVEQLQRLAGYLPERERSGTSGPGELYGRLSELTHAELVLLLDRVSQELRARDGLAPPSVP